VVHDLDSALLLLNGWLGRPLQLLVLIRNGAPPGELPPSQPSPGWHVVLGRKARLGRPKLAEATDLERQLTVGTYELGDGPLKLLFGDLPYQRVLALGKDDQPDRLAFYLPGSTVVPRRVAWHRAQKGPAFLFSAGAVAQAERLDHGSTPNGCGLVPRHWITDSRWPRWSPVMGSRENAPKKVVVSSRRAA
jgi:hypothetical protein